MPFLLAEASFSDANTLLIAAVSAMAGAIAYLIFWIRSLYAAQLKEPAAEIARRDALLERVLVTCMKVTEAVEVLVEELKSRSRDRP